MKSPSAILVISVAINLVLLVTYVQRRTSQVELTSSSSSEIAKSAAGTETVATPRRSPLWTRLDTTDLDVLAHRLQEAGFSRREIRVVMLRRIMAKYNMRASRERSPGPYWRNDSIDYTDPKILSELQAHSAEQEEALLKDVRDPELLADDPEALDSAQRRYGNLPLEKLRALSTIDADYQQLLSKEIAANGLSNEARARYFRETYALLEKEKEADIARLLTPDEYADYELRGSRTAMNLRRGLETFKPSEQEYKAIFAITKSFEEKLLDNNLTPEVRRSLREQMNAQAAATLGADRAADYLESQRGMDKTARLIARLDLPARTYATVRSIQQDVTQRATAIRADSTLSAADRSTQLTALAQQAQTQLTSTLGDRGYEAYNDMKGDWIRALAQPVSVTP